MKLESGINDRNNWRIRWRGSVRMRLIFRVGCLLYFLATLRALSILVFMTLIFFKAKFGCLLFLYLTTFWVVPKEKREL